MSSLKKQESEGAEAYRSGKTIGDNPYDEQTYWQEHVAWKHAFETEKAFWNKYDKVSSD